MKTNSFIESLSMILDESNQYSMMMENTYYIHELSLSEKIRKIDFKKIIKFIFDRFIGILKSIWDRFRAAYHQYTSKSSLIKKYRKKLENIDWDINLDIDRSIFTNLDSSTHISMYKMRLEQEYSTLIAELENISNSKGIGNIHTSIMNIKNNMEPFDTFMNQERALSIGSRSVISREDYAREVVNYFKPDTKIVSSTIHPSEAKQYVKDYFESKTLEKVITRDESILRSSATAMTTKIQSISIDKYLPNQEINQDIANVFTEIIREYCNRVKGICDIYLQLFSIKLDMFKLYKEQQVKVLSKIILESIKGGKM